MSLTKTLKFDNDVLEVLKRMSVQPCDSGFIGIISEQLDRNLYINVNKALEAMGGTWNRKAKGHIFTEDPRTYFESTIDSGKIVIERDGFFETPKTIVEMMIKKVGVLPGKTMRNKKVVDEQPYTILEPSAGMGAITSVLEEHGISFLQIHCCEKNKKRAEFLASKGYKVVCDDFLATTPEEVYDRVFMNPPFEELQDIDHVRHAYKFLKQGGRLVSVMSEGPFFRNDKKAVEFRKWLEPIGYSQKLDQNSFEESGTGVNTRLVIIHKVETWVHDAPIEYSVVVEEKEEPEVPGFTQLSFL